MRKRRACWRDVVVVLGLVAAFARAAAAAAPESNRAPAVTSGPAAPASGSAEPASVLLVTIDTLRYDRTRDGGPMPCLLRLAREGVSFSQARAQTPLTLPSHATILTGVGVERHGVRDNVGAALPAAIPTVAEAFRRAGWKTAAFISGYPLAREFGLSRGFERYDDTMTRAAGFETTRPVERPGRETVARASEWLARQRTGPLFLWVHLYDPHDPYEPPPDLAKRFATPYDGEVAAADAALSALLEAAAPRRWWVLVTSDHGESLGEHGEGTHGVFLYDSTLHVPLVVAAPGAAIATAATRPTGTARPGASASSSRVPPSPTAASASTDRPLTIDEPVFLFDVAPTLIEMAGLPVPAGLQGRSLLPAMSRALTAAGRGALPGIAAWTAPSPRAVYLETLHPRRRYGWSELRGLFASPWKWIDAPRAELYDVSSEAGESHPLADTSRSADMKRQLDALTAAARPPAPAAPAREDLDKLASLGYTGGSIRPAGQAPETRRRPDPKDRIAVLPDLDAALEAMAKGDAGVARRRLDAVLAHDPDNLVALNNLGILEMRSGRSDRAEAIFRRGLAADPGAERIASDLGLSLARQGRHADAAEAYRRALALDPTFTAARFNLAIALHRLGRSDEALRELETVRSVEPDFPGLRDTLATVQAAASRK